QLKARIVAGAANNLLEHPEHDAMLRDRGVLYAPDFAINAGGIIDVFYERAGATPETVRAHVDTIGDTLTEIFNRADRSGRPTGEIANELAEERFKKHIVGAGQASERLARTG
ncbi:MAG: amino acid dehydrogenase, partial [Marinobacter sp.]|nr:amino acid dehydrogenase [Marinobacter sp.]